MQAPSNPQGQSPKAVLEADPEVAGTKVHRAVQGVDLEASNRNQASPEAGHADGNATTQAKGVRRPAAGKATAVTQAKGIRRPAVRKAAEMAQMEMALQAG